VLPLHGRHDRLQSGSDDCQGALLNRHAWHVAGPQSRLPSSPKAVRAGLTGVSRNSAVTILWRIKIRHFQNESYQMIVVRRDHARAL
jgi:hypothetical protein